MSNIAISYTRFSSLGQADGDSVRRQVKLAEDYAAKHGLVIDQSLSFRDLGVSAYDQSNIRKGALGLFLQAANEGRIPRGATLIVESFDRLSRAAPLDALSVFTDILNAGLNLVTLTDGKRFSRETVRDNPFQLFESLVVMFRAHEESEMKSKRGKAVWSAKKANALASGKVMTRKTPYWIRTKPDKSGFELIPERAKVALMLVEESEQGSGANSLLRRLNAEGIEPWSKSGSWQPSYMQKLLRNPALFGAMLMKDGTLIRDYYPAVIDEDRYHRLKALRSDRATTQSTSGRGKTVTNIFSRRLKCGYCGFSMMVGSYCKGETAERKRYERRYVACAAARIAAVGGCSKIRVWFMDELEPKLLLWLTALNPASLLGGDRTKLDRAKQAVDGIAGRLAECERSAANITKAIEDGDAPKALVARLKALEAEKDTLAQELTQAEKQLSAQEALRSNGQERLTAMLALFKALKQTDDEGKQRELRQKLAAAISLVVKQVTLYPTGPSAGGSKAQRYMVVELQNGQKYEVDDADEPDDACLEDAQAALSCYSAATTSLGGAGPSQPIARDVQRRGRVLLSSSDHN